MEFFEEFSEIIKPEGGKILLCVLDGVGGIPYKNGQTELESARTPNLDKLAKESSKGLLYPVFPGVTPGSGPGHLALFGYDPRKRFIKRGIMEAIGVGVDIEKKDIAARGNYATVEYKGASVVVKDRRAGRITTEENKRLSNLLSKVKKIGDTKIFVYPVKEHRLCVVFKGPGLYDNVSDTDPQKENREPLEPKNLDRKSKKMSKIAEEFIHMSGNILRSEEKANYILLRGFSSYPNIPSFQEVWKIKAGAIAVYPMYKGITKILGFDVLNLPSDSIKDEVNLLSENSSKYDFFYFHFKKTDSAGEDGDFDRKVAAVEEFDAVLPDILNIGFDVVCITADHSTPSLMKSHSFHPVPVVINSKVSFRDGEGRFTERDCGRGILGRLMAQELMPILFAHSGRLEKYGA